MSKRETPLTRGYWATVGGLLIEEFQMVSPESGGARRLADGLIVLGEKPDIHATGKYDIAGRDVIVVQTKANRLGMSLLGQCLFSRDLVRRLGPRSVKSVALCTQDDPVLRALLEAYEGCEVVVFEPS